MRLFTRPIFLTGLILVGSHGATAAVITNTVGFSGASQSFGLSITAGGNVSVSGNGTFHLLDSGIVRSHKTINIPSQSVPVALTGGTATVSTHPVGTAEVAFDERTLGQAAISNLTVDLLNGTPLNFALNPIVFHVNIESIGNVGLRVDISGSINSLTFQSNPGSNPAPGFFVIPGQLTANISGRATAVAQDVIGGADFNLGEIASFNSTDSSDFDLPGLFTLTDLGAPYPANVGVGMGISLPIAIPFDLATSGSDSQVEGHGTGNVDLFMNYSISAMLTLNNLNYSLNGVVPASYIPEVSSVWLVMSAFGVLSVLGRRRLIRS